MKQLWHLRTLTVAENIKDIDMNQPIVHLLLFKRAELAPYNNTQNKSRVQMLDEGRLEQSIRQCGTSLYCA